MFFFFANVFVFIIAKDPFNTILGTLNSIIFKFWVIIKFMPSVATSISSSLIETSTGIVNKNALFYLIWQYLDTYEPIQPVIFCH